MKCKIVVAAAAILLLAMPVYAANDTGIIPCLLTSWSGRGAMVSESNLGDAAADALRMATGTDAAIVSGGDIPDNALQPGECSRQDVEAAFTNDRKIAVCEMSYSEFADLLEAGVSHITLNENGELDIEASAYEGFPQVSGITFRFDALAEPGGRIMQISMENGETIDPEDDDTMLMVAASDFLLGGGYDTVPHEYMETDLNYSDAMMAYITDGITVNYTSANRIRMAGDRSDTIISRIPAPVIPVLLLVTGIWGYVQNKRRRAIGDYKWDERYNDFHHRPLM